MNKYWYAMAEKIFHFFVIKESRKRKLRYKIGINCAQLIFGSSTMLAIFDGSSVYISISSLILLIVSLIKAVHDDEPHQLYTLLLNEIDFVRLKIEQDWFNLKLTSSNEETYIKTIYVHEEEWSKTFSKFPIYNFHLSKKAISRASMDANDYMKYTFDLEWKEIIWVEKKVTLLLTMLE